MLGHEIKSRDGFLKMTLVEVLYQTAVKRFKVVGLFDQRC